MATKDQSGAPVLAELAELNMLRNDVTFYRDMFLGPHSERFVSAAALSLMPFVSAFVLDSSSYVRKSFVLDTKFLDDHESMLISSRLRMKIHEDRARTFAQRLERARRLASINSSWFLQEPGFVKKSMRKLLNINDEPVDLGISFIDNDVISTTHVQFLNLGLSEELIAQESLTIDNVGPYIRSITTDYGSYMGQLSDELGLARTSSLGEAFGMSPDIKDIDLKSEDLYEPMSEWLTNYDAAMCILLTSILSQVNAARYLTPSMPENRRIAHFKVKFLAAYHGLMSLQYLINMNVRAKLLQPKADELFRSACSLPCSRSLRKKRQLRNHLVHYEVQQNIAAKLSPDLPCFGLVEATSNRASIGQVSEEVDAVLLGLHEHLSTMLPRALYPNIAPK